MHLETMKIVFEQNGQKFQSDLSAGRSLAIDLDFEGPQPNHFGAPKAKRSGLKLGQFVGRTERGGGCNVDQLELIPHCNGTHTETVSHIVDDEIFVVQVVKPEPVIALIVSVEPTAAANTSDSYRPPFGPDDKVVTAEQIASQIGTRKDFEALIVRTLPNVQSKTSQAYTDDHQPPYLTVDAMQAIVESGAKHLLLDVPSVDRMHDEGLLTNHHLFWNVPEQSHQLTADTWQDKTITEMIFVPDDIKDGLYLLSIQVPAFCTDAAPSRPVVFSNRARARIAS